jgi:hypothetical protein
VLSLAARVQTPARRWRFFVNGDWGCRAKWAKLNVHEVLSLKSAIEMRSTATTFAFACTLLLSQGVEGQDVGAEDQLQRWVDYYTQRAAQYEIVSSADESVQLELRPEPLLTYTNPIRGRDQHGAVFAWTCDGRPQALGSIWSIANTNSPDVRRTAHEIHSLASYPLAVQCPASADPQATRSSDVA